LAPITPISGNFPEFLKVDVTIFISHRFPSQMVAMARDEQPLYNQAVTKRPINQMSRNIKLMLVNWVDFCFSV
tara:strand:- start:645 stop:863 length:219 start_codon:yes stop_codon:yes gene_type:complete